jgi:hypothetical protein
MSEPLPGVRVIGHVEDLDGYRGTIGVVGNMVTVAASPSPVAPVLRLSRDQAEEFARLFVRACWEAAAQGGAP